MKTDIILAGVGGQGILSIANAIGVAALKSNLQVKQAETHGMSVRGGAVVSHLRLSDSTIYSDLISKGKADMILAVEPMEALRYLPYLSKDGFIVTNTEPFNNIAKYPDMDKLIQEIEKNQHVVAINADGIAEELGNKLVSNMVLLGASIPFLKQIDISVIESGVKEIFSRKGDEVVNLNLKALEAGRKFAEEVVAK